LADPVHAGSHAVPDHAGATDDVSRGGTLGDAARVGVEGSDTAAASLGSTRAAQLVQRAVIVVLALVDVGMGHRVRWRTESWPRLSARHTLGAEPTLCTITLGVGVPAGVTHGASAASDCQTAVVDAAFDGWTRCDDTHDDLR